MTFLDLAKKRCSTRSFSDKLIDASKLDYILEAGRVAPTACNRQPQRILVIQTPKGLKKIKKAYNTFNSTCILVIGRDIRENLVRPYDYKCSGDLDLGIITDHMMLAAREVGIGSVMVGLFDPFIVKREFNIPPYIELSALLILGYPRRGFLSPNRHTKKRKELRYTVMTDSYLGDEEDNNRSSLENWLSLGETPKK